MSKIQVITDTASDIRGQRKEELGVETVPLMIRFGDNVFRDDSELSVAEFYDRMAEEKELPQTAAPSPGDFEKAFLKAKEEGNDAVICITLSSQLSATFQSAEIAAKSVGSEIPIHLLDSNSVTAGQAIQVIDACRLVKDGKGPEAILEELTETQKRIKCFGVINNLVNLKKGGRIGGTQAFFGAALNIKPIIDLSLGKVEAAAKVRTRKKSFDWLCRQVAEAKNPRSIAIGHGNADDWDVLMEKMGGVTDPQNLLTGEIGPVIGTHAGVGVVGLAYIEE